MSERAWILLLSGTRLDLLGPDPWASTTQQADVIRGKLAAKRDHREGATPVFEMESDHETVPGALWIHASECGEPEHVARFAPRCAEALHLDRGRRSTRLGFLPDSNLLEAVRRRVRRQRARFGSYEVRDGLQHRLRWPVHRMRGSGEVAGDPGREARQEDGP
jgi:hypothetical protein